MESRWLRGSVEGDDGNAVRLNQATLVRRLYLRYVKTDHVRTSHPVGLAQRSGSAAGRAADRPLQPVVRRPDLKV
ncbi:MAG: hypothetical protein HY706_04790 [Candidatus Hydrogenedentes bacterium]|nr:hypothetical protein [Candidatus Hydrogenedentota bacterium]